MKNILTVDTVLEYTLPHINPKTWKILELIICNKLEIPFFRRMKPKILSIRNYNDNIDNYYIFVKIIDDFYNENPTFIWERSHLSYHGTYYNGWISLNTVYSVNAIAFHEKVDYFIANWEAFDCCYPFEKVNFHFNGCESHSNNILGFVDKLISNSKN